jgi:aminopeptidase-like protein
MALHDSGTHPESAGVGDEMYQLIGDLFPICRSITGDGVRETLGRLQKHVPLTIHEVPSGTPAFDWTVPREWNIKDAYVKNRKGERVIDFKKSNLHVLNYSIPVRKIVSLEELRQHLFSLPEHPEWIPYRTSYYTENWGFCVPHRQIGELTDAQYEVCIDATLTDGHLTYGEWYLEGRTRDEVLISCHVCHPTLANDNLSGVAVATFLAKHLTSITSLEYSYRFLFVPGTIGSITWLSLHEHDAQFIRHGLVLAGLGDSGPLNYKKSRRGNAEIDATAQHVLRHSQNQYGVFDFSPYGYDERQFCSPGFNLPVGCLTRTSHGRYPEHHTSADNLNFVHPRQLAGSLSTCARILEVLEHNTTYLSLNQKCEPQLGKRGLYRAIGGIADAGRVELAMLWLLNLSDGSHALLEIAERAGLPFEMVLTAARALVEHGLLEQRRPLGVRGSSNS